MSQRRNVFGEVRSLLATPGPKAFAAVCAWWPEGDVPEEIITYVRDVTSRWPDMYPCMVPQAWRERVERGERVPGVKVCSAFCFDGEEKALQKWAGCEELSALRSIRLELVHIRADTGAIEQLLCHEQLSCIESLELSYGPRRLDVDRLASAQVLRGLRSLSLYKVPLEPRVLVELLCSSHLARLESLSLRECRLAPRMWRAMAGATRLPSLSSLTLQRSTLIGDEMRALLDVLPSRGMMRMRLESCQFGLEGMSAFAESSKIQDVQELGLSKYNLATKDLLTLMQSPRLTSLRTLEISHTTFDTSKMSALVDHPGMNGVERLVLDSCGFEQGAIEVLSRGARTSALGVLDLNGCTITEREAHMLLSGPGPYTLRELSCYDVQGDTDRVRRLAERYGVLFTTGCVGVKDQPYVMMRGRRVRPRGLLKPRAMTNRLPSAEGMDQDEVLETPEWLRRRRTDSER